MAAKKSPTRTGTSTAPKTRPKAKNVIVHLPRPAQTVIYCHGIGDKPPERELRSIWDHALFNVDQGERTRMAYWVDRQRYPDDGNLGSRTIRGIEAATTSGYTEQLSEQLLKESIQDSDSTDASEKFLRALEAELQSGYTDPQAGPGARAVGAKGLWTHITAIFTRLFLADVNDFLFNTTKRDRMVKSVTDRIKTGGGPFVVIGHSQGSMVAWQALMELGDQVEVELFITLGSPLGLPQVRGELKKWHCKSLPIPPGVKRWINVARNGDIVCADKTLAGEYNRAGLTVEDFYIRDWALMPKAHDAAYYLSYGPTREAVHAAVDTARFQPISGFAVARDLTEAFDQAPERREPVLIELTDRASDSAPVQNGDLLKVARDTVVDWIRTKVCTPDVTVEDIQLDVLHRYVSAHLTRDQVERLAVQLGRSYGRKAPGVYRIYKNSRKKALATAADLQPGLAAIHAPTAHLGYNARGRNIAWAVLDTGIDQGHPHFDTPNGNSIVAAWDCTRLGSPQPADPARDRDPNGHGTHVGGIIAGGPDPAKYPGLAGISSVAPDARLVSYKVLANDGSGNDAWIIKAIDHIWEQNEHARRLVIHGANLSLGGPFDAASFGCGDSPLCASLLRLIRQGVLVVLAAGNEGIGEVIVDGNPTSLSLDLSIGDPANLEEGIAVGSVHPGLPHRYGTSYFSSRGPTADGRAKPDVVAPGERILSCRSRRSAATPANASIDDLYVRLSGTSMAAPHVSGLLAAFLSARTEFIGYPERVKRLLTEHCTDLKRDRYHQGAGVPNLTRMLLQV